MKLELRSFFSHEINSFIIKLKHILEAIYRDLPVETWLTATHFLSRSLYESTRNPPIRILISNSVCAFGTPHRPSPIYIHIVQPLYTIRVYIRFDRTLNPKIRLSNTKQLIRRIKRLLFFLYGHRGELGAKAIDDGHIVCPNPLVSLSLME